MSTSNDHVEEVSGGAEMSVLDLPELVLECILEKLPPSGLCNMAAVCSSLRDRCMSDRSTDEYKAKLTLKSSTSSSSFKDLLFTIDRLNHELLLE